MEVIDGLKVTSQADGNMRITIRYNIKPMTPGATPLGVFDRMAVADVIEEVLKDELSIINLRLDPDRDHERLAQEE